MVENVTSLHPNFIFAETSRLWKESDNKGRKREGGRDGTLRNNQERRINLGDPSGRGRKQGNMHTRLRDVLHEKHEKLAKWHKVATWFMTLIYTWYSETLADIFTDITELTSTITKTTCHIMWGGRAGRGGAGGGTTTGGMII